MDLVNLLKRIYNFLSNRTAQSRKKLRAAIALASYDRTETV